MLSRTGARTARSPHHRFRRAVALEIDSHRCDRHRARFVPDHPHAFQAASHQLLACALIAPTANLQPAGSIRGVVHPAVSIREIGAGRDDRLVGVLVGGERLEYRVHLPAPQGGQSLHCSRRAWHYVSGPDRAGRIPDVAAGVLPFQDLRGPNEVAIRNPPNPRRPIAQHRHLSRRAVHPGARLPATAELQSARVPHAARNSWADPAG